MSKLFNLICLIAIVWAIILVFCRNEHHHHVKSEYERLASIYGSLEVKDPARYLVKNISSDPKYLSWRIYQPAMPTGMQMCRQTITSRSRSSDSGPQESKEMNVSFRFRVVDGEPQVYQRSDTSSSMIYFPRQIRGFIIEHWDSLDFDVLAMDGPVEIDAEEVVSLLAIKVPTELIPELGTDAQGYLKDLQAGPLLRLDMGSDTAFENWIDNP